jgi:hypothetical protein
MDELFGELRYDYGWVREYSLRLFGREQVVELAIVGDRESPIEEAQREAFRHFERSREAILGSAEVAILQYYLDLREDYRPRLGELAEKMTPAVNSTTDLSKIVTPTSVILPESFGTDGRVVGLLCDCSWDPNLGVAVKIVNEIVTEVGPQDIVL